jgi:hypothetical protein
LDELEKTGEEVVVDYFMLRPEISLERLRKIKNNLNHYRRCPGAPPTSGP